MGKSYHDDIISTNSISVTKSQDIQTHYVLNSKIATGEKATSKEEAQKLVEDEKLHYTQVVLAVDKNTKSGKIINKYIDYLTVGGENNPIAKNLNVMVAELGIKEIKPYQRSDNTLTASIRGRVNDVFVLIDKNKETTYKDPLFGKKMTTDKEAER